MNSKESLESLEQFLSAFKVKLTLFGVYFIEERPKNSRTILILEISTQKRWQIISGLTRHDFVKGPMAETMHGAGEMWVFGRTINHKEVYIKIAIGKPNNSTICISFHIAEYPLEYPYK